MWTEGYSHIERSRYKPTPISDSKKNNNNNNKRHLAKEYGESQKNKGQKWKAMRQLGCLVPSSPAGLPQSIRLGARRPAQTAIVDDGVVRQHGNDASAHPHPTGQLLVAHDAMPFVCDDDMAVPTALPSRLAVSELQLGGHGYALCFAQPCHDPGLVDEAVGGSYPPAEVCLEGADGEIIGDQPECRRGREAGAVLGQQIQRWIEVGLVGWRRLKIEGE